jgi:hypothetical protein
VVPNFVFRIGTDSRCCRYWKELLRHCIDVGSYQGVPLPDDYANGLSNDDEDDDDEERRNMDGPQWESLRAQQEGPEFRVEM